MLQDVGSAQNKDLDPESPMNKNTMEARRQQECEALEKLAQSHEVAIEQLWVKIDEIRK